MPLDNTRDSIAFKHMMGRLCAALNSVPYSDDLMDAWWKALRHCSYASVELRVDTFIAKATPETKFPRPSQMRDPDDTPPSTAGDSQDFHRGYWRSLIVQTVARELGLTMTTLEPVIIANRETLGARMRELLEEAVAKDHDRSMTTALQVLCIQNAQRIARYFDATREVAA